MDLQSDVEVYIRDCTVERAVAWIRSAIGPLAGPFEAGSSVVYHLTGGAVVLTSSVGDGRFLSVWFNTPIRPWLSDVECARAAARDLGCVVRCDPGAARPDISPYSDAFLEIDGEAESIVVWTDHSDV